MQHADGQVKTIFNYAFILLTMWKTKKKPKTPWLLVRKRIIPTERPPLVGEVSANFCG
jgi:hypothetical protein